MQRVNRSSLKQFCGLLAAVMLAACSPDQPVSENQHQHHEEMTMPRDKPISGHSLYLLDSEWTDQSGETVKLSDFTGNIVVLAMVYTHCDYACPRIIGDMRRIRQQLGATGERLSFVLASIDPERDTVAHLQKFGQDTGLTEQGWRLLRAPEDTIRELAAVLGVRYQRVSATDFAHSNVITVLDREGRIAHQQVGLGVSPTETVAAIKALAAQNM